MKVHKNNYPLRPVILMIDFPNMNKCNVKFVVSLIKLLIPNKCMLHSTDDFFYETINIIADYIFSNDNTHKPLMDKHIFVKLLCLASEGLFFFYNPLNKVVHFCITYKFTWST